MFKGLTWLVLKTELNRTNAQKSATVCSGSVHKTNCRGRTVTLPQVSLWKHQDCAAITGTAAQAGQNETPAQIHVNKSCSGNPSQHVWRFVSVCKLTDWSDFKYRPSPYSLGSFSRSKTAGARGWLLTCAVVKKRDSTPPHPPTPQVTFNPIPTPSHRTSYSTN
jgi:hypothetical protein